MANPEHLKVLKQPASDWNEWRNAHRGPHIDLSDADLRRADLIGADLSGAYLVGAHLVGADLRKANLDGADLRKANLSWANLSGAFLSAADLSAANLRAVQLGGATLRRADLSGADLSEAHLRGADLRRADLAGADLRRTDLSGTTLIGANLTDAHLTGANLRGADLARTVFCGARLRGVEGLGAVRHFGPSVLDHETLNEWSDIPLAFLRGVGLPDWLFDTYRSHLGGGAVDSCVISHGQEDKTFAGRLHDGLQGRGVRCWLDEHQRRPGDDRTAGIDRRAPWSAKVLLCCSKASLSSWWVEQEFDLVTEKERRQGENDDRAPLALIPLNLDGHFSKWARKRSGQARVAVDFTGWEKDSATFEAQLERVVEALRAGDRAT